jgi:catechol 2,3-dioxygenase-like lactoylglutathione lyase family enzyme
MASGRAIDHVVLAVRNLDRAAQTYQKLGFTLTPRAMHEDRMGTSNRLAQFGGMNFIELLEVDLVGVSHENRVDVRAVDPQVGEHAVEVTPRLDRVLAPRDGGVVAEIASSVRVAFRATPVARVLPGLEPKHAYGRGLETLASSGAISY